MFGFLRVVLAACVALNHVEVAFAGRNIGVVSVVMFYILAGYVVAVQWQTISRDRAFKPSLVAFARDRALRLLPGYFAVLAIGVIVVATLHPESYFLQRGASLECVFANVSIVPLNYFSFNSLDQCTLIPVAWSLALEIQFYIVAPLILFASVRWSLVLVVASLLVYLLANWGAIDTDTFGYRLLPGTLFMFLVGASIARLGPSFTAGRSPGIGVDHWLIALVFGMTMATAMTTIFGWREALPFAMETSVGLSLGVPLVLVLQRIRRSRLDDFVGMIAYPLFLLHFPVLWMLNVWSPGLIETVTGKVIYMAITALFALAVVWGVDAPIGRWRRRMRAKT